MMAGSRLLALRASAWPIAALALALAACTRPAPDSALAHSTRFVSLPSSVAALSQAEREPGLPAQLSFSGAQGRSALFLKFAIDFQGRAPLRAYIALTPREGAAVDSAPVTLEAWRIKVPWQQEQLVSWSDKPELGPPYARARVESSSATQQRIDVTELVRFAAKHPELDFGIAVLGRTGSGHGATFSTGISGGQAPRLEVYLR